MLVGSGLLVAATDTPASAQQQDCPEDSVCAWAEPNYGGERTDYGESSVNKCENAAFGSVKNNMSQDSQINLLIYSEGDCAGEAADSIPPGGFARGTRSGKSLKLQQNPKGESSSGEAGKPGEGQKGPLDDILGGLPRPPG